MLKCPLYKLLSILAERLFTEPYFFKITCFQSSQVNKIKPNQKPHLISCGITFIPCNISLSSLTRWSEYLIWFFWLKDSNIFIFQWQKKERKYAECLGNNYLLHYFCLAEKHTSTAIISFSDIYVSHIIHYIK